MDISNNLSTKDKLIFIIISIALFSYGSYGIWNNDLIIWYSARADAYLRIHGFSLWMMYGAIISVCLRMLSNFSSNSKYRTLTENCPAFFLAFLILSLYSTIYMAVSTNA